MRNLTNVSLVLLAVAALSGCQACGYSSQENELTGQVKKLVKRTPVVCPDYTEVDMSLGYLRNGMGSVSKEDVVLTVRNPQDIPLLKAAAESGVPVDAVYNVFRVSNCEPDHELISVQVVK